LVDSCPGGKSEFLFEIDMSKTKYSLVELREATPLKSISFKEQSLQASLHVSVSFS
jgi:hypothetical protein